jgi:hypothetical protein
MPRHLCLRIYVLVNPLKTNFPPQNPAATSGTQDEKLTRRREEAEVLNELAKDAKSSQSFIHHR